ncbi:MAG: hypothetical protein ACWGMZ_01860, partial [Thermoguttaceae bacterium]
LRRELSANFHEAAALGDILDYLGQESGVNILIDRRSLAAAGISDKSELLFVVDNRPLAEALSVLLAPLKLGYRAIDSHTIQAASQTALDTRPELEFYSVAKLLKKGLEGSSIVEQVKKAVASDSWQRTGSPGAIYFDQPSATLIVLQSPAVQREIQAFLDQIQK